MQGKYILLALVVIFLLFPPTAAATNKIAAGAPVFIGETNLDISKALDNCRIIGWWPEGADTSTGPGEKNITLRPLNELSTALSHYTISVEDYAGYPGNWYCEEKKPRKVVFVVREPQVLIRVWDLDNDRDVSGKTIPMATNITYRIETNMDAAMQLRYRPDLTPADSFWTVKLTNPYGQGITNIYTGSAGASDTQVLTLDSAPRVTTSPYLWSSGSAWNRASKNKIGELLYPAGKYTFTVSQNLNGMAGVYKAAGITDTAGKLSNSTDVTFEQPVMVTSTVTVPPSAESTAAPDTPAVTPAAVVPALTELTTTPVPTKTPYQPLPAWIAVAALGTAAVLLGIRRNR